MLDLQPIASPLQTEAPSQAPDRQLRVLFLTNIIPPYHLPLLTALSRNFAAFRILLSTPMENNRPWHAEWRELDVHLQKTWTFHRRWRHPAGFSEPLFVHAPLDTYQQIARFQPDIVVSWEMGLRTTLAAAYHRLHPRTKLMVWAEFAESTEYGRGPARQLFRRSIHRFIDGFLVTGQSGTRYLRDLGIPARKLHTIAYSTDVEHFAVAPLHCDSSAAHRLLYVGQVIDRKGLVPFVEALALWGEKHPDRRIEFRLAGDGPVRPWLAALPLPANITLTFLGNLPYALLPAVYAQAGIFVFPTLADTWGVVVNEALAAGLPVLGSTQGQAVSELVTDGVNGWTFTPAHPGSLASALDRCLATPEAALDPMRTHARATALRLNPAALSQLITSAIVTCRHQELK